MPTQQTTTIGIIAGSGQFPFLIAKEARQKGYRVVACGFIGNTDPKLEEYVDAFILIPLGKLNTLITFLKKHNVVSACMAGAINKPRALDVKPDFRAAKLIFRLASSKGDDAILRGVAAELACDGINLIAPESLAPSLKGPVGVLTKKKLSPELWQDIIFGFTAGRHMGQLDIGQCLIVKSGMVIAVEAIEGTDATIKRAGELAKDGCTVIKLAKRTQDTRLDLPSIGEQTIQLLVQYNYAALAYEAEKTLFFDQQASVALANAHGISIIGLPSDPSLFFQQEARCPK